MIPFKALEFNLKLFLLMKDRTRTWVGQSIAPKGLHDFVLKVAEVVAKPTNYSEASQIAEWVDAMEHEMKSIHKNNIWTLVDLLVIKKPITTKWVYKIETHVDGSTTKFQMQLVVHGFQLQAREDFDETYAPIVNTTFFA